MGSGISPHLPFAGKKNLVHLRSAFMAPVSPISPGCKPFTFPESPSLLGIFRAHLQTVISGVYEAFLNHHFWCL